MIMEMGTITSTGTVMDITSRHRRRLLPMTTFTTPPLTAACNRDPRIYEAHALTARDPTQWFCIAVDDDGIARFWASGASEVAARRRAELAVGRCDRKQAWSFVFYPPD